MLVNASRNLAKTYYARPFSSGDAEMPDCWSLDSIRPDSSIAKPVNPTCQDCPKNAFNSAPSGRGGKACQDSKRVVITTTDQLGQAEPLLLLMRLPQQSLKNLKNHVEKLAGHGYIEPYSCVSRMSFDMDVEFPKVQFDFVEPLTDEEFDAAEAVANSKKVNDMLKNPDFDNAASDANAKHAADEGRPSCSTRSGCRNRGLLRRLPLRICTTQSLLVSMPKRRPKHGRLVILYGRIWTTALS